MKRIAGFVATCGIILIMIGIGLYYKEDVLTLVNKYFSGISTKIELDEVNEYYHYNDFMFVQNTRDFYPKSKQDIYNIYYTIINSGKDEFSFMCEKDFTECLDYVEELANDQNTLSDINNYVHPFNGFSHIETAYDSTGKVTISILHTYSPEQIHDINLAVDTIYETLYDENDTIENNLKIFHDYIIDHAKYDEARAEHGDTTYHSDMAYGPLFEGYGICSGYTDLMQLILERMGIVNYRVSSDIHIWNALKIDDTWYNLDLTWDDPVTTDGSDSLLYDFFLIDTDKMLSLDKEKHTFNYEHYMELKKEA